METTEHAGRNRAFWNASAEDWVERGRESWRSEPHWGEWRIPETEVGVLGDLAGLDAVELGCGTAYFSAWLARAGARPVGVDLSERQLETARALQAEHGLEFPLVHASAEDVPLPDASFDLALSEYGASIWCDPELWLREAARLLRPGGRLVFLTNSVLVMLCTPLSGEAAGERLHRPLFGMKRFEWPDEEGIEFHLPHGEMLRLLRRVGFDVEDLVELQAPAGARTRCEYVSTEWATKWPAEEIWVARKRG